MFKSIKTAYGAGWRAGMNQLTLESISPLISLVDILLPKNPYRDTFNRIRECAWDKGLHDGRKEAMNAWIEKRAMRQKHKEIGKNYA